MARLDGQVAVEGKRPIGYIDFQPSVFNPNT